LSFHKWSLTKPGPWRFVGLLNYWDILKNPVFWRVILNTFVFTVSAVTLEFVIGLGLAHLFYRQLRGESVVRSILVLPMMIPPILIGLIWLFMYKKDFGIINNMLKLLSIEPITWLSKPSTAMPAIIIADIWQWTPFVVLLVTAGLQTIPREEYEAATIDRASGWMQFWKISMPYLRSNLMIAALFRMIDTFRMFDLVYILTGGGPGNSTQTLSVAAYKLGYQFFQTGKAAAISWLMVIIVTVMATLLMKVLSEKKRTIPAVAP